MVENISNIAACRKSSPIDSRSMTSGQVRRTTRATYIPHKDKPEHIVEKRNARERRRVEAVNNAFISLRNVIPYKNRSKRLSKAKTLSIAINYIQTLQDMIFEHDSSLSSCMWEQSGAYQDGQDTTGGCSQVYGNETTCTINKRLQLQQTQVPPSTGLPHTPPSGLYRNYPECTQSYQNLTYFCNMENNPQYCDRGSSPSQSYENSSPLSQADVIPHFARGDIQASCSPPSGMLGNLSPPEGAIIDHQTVTLSGEMKHQLSHPYSLQIQQIRT